jgi:hypothetical protein
MNSDQATQAESSDHDKELVDAALSQAGVTSSVPPTQPVTSFTPPVSEGVSAPTVGVENSYSPTNVTASPEVEESTASSAAPVVGAPITNTVVPEIPVNDSTVVSPESTAPVAISEPVQEAQANDPINQAQTMSAPSLDQQPSAAPVMQIPAQPEGLVAKFLHIFKK